MGRDKSSIGKTFLVLLIVFLCAAFLFALIINVLDYFFGEKEFSLQVADNDVVFDNELLKYKQLNENQKSIYDTLLANIKSNTAEITIEETNYNDYVDDTEVALEAITHDFPEYFWISNSFELSGIKGPDYNDDTVTITLDSGSMYGDDIQKEYNLLMNAVDVVVKGAEGFITEYEKALYVHDFLAQNSVYDVEAAERLDNGTLLEENEKSFTAYGCLVNKLCVCEGYAEAYSIILSRLGIHNTLVDGTSNGEPHRWNLIKIKDQCYYVDVTWDDDDEGNYVYHDYFCITTKELLKNHEIDTSMFEYPACTDNEFNYHTYNHFFVLDGETTNIDEVINKQSDAELVSLKFDSPDCYEKVTNQIETEGLLGSQYIEAKYNLNSELMIINLFDIRSLTKVDTDSDSPNIQTETHNSETSIESTEENITTNLTETIDSNVKDELFYITENGEKYHRRDCVSIQNKVVYAITEVQARQSSHTPCGLCLPNG